MHISYYDSTNQYLKYANNVSGCWMNLDVRDVRVQDGSSITIDHNGKAHISYYSYYGSYLDYSSNSTGNWVHLTVDGTGDVGNFNAIAIDGNGKVYISNYDETNGDLKYATNASGLSFLPAIYYLLLQ